MTNDCNLTKEDEIWTKEGILIVHHVAYDVLGIVILAFGIVCSIINLFVLTKPNLKDVVYVYLVALGISNLFALVFGVPLLQLLSNPFEPYSSTSYYTAFFYAFMAHPLLNAFLHTSVYITIFSTINLFLAMYKPIYFRDIYTIKNARINVLISFCIGTVLNIPYMFLRKVHKVCLDVQETITCHEDDHSTNSSMNEDNIELLKLYKDETNSTQSPNNTYIVCNNKNIGGTIGFKIYSHINSVILRIGPIIFISILMFFIVIRLKRFMKRKQRHAVRSTEVTFDGNLGAEENLCNKEERKMVPLLIAIAINFVILNTPTNILTILFFHDRSKFSCSIGYAVYRAVANLLEFVGLCLNLFIYCLCSKEIRKAYINLIFRNSVISFIKSRLCRNV